MMIPSSKICCASVGMLPGTRPPVSVMWPNIAAQPITRPFLKMGSSTSQSGVWLMAPSQE